MSIKNLNKKRLRFFYSFGFASIEYLIVSSFVMMLLFLGEPSLAIQLVDAMKKYYSALTYIISLP
jgi:hypothetical protein